MTLSIKTRPAPGHPTTPALAPVRRRSLADDLAQRIKDMIDAGDYAPDARLPTITAMAQRFGVGPPTVREALKKLETLGAVDIRHGSGVYVGARPNPLFVSNPVLSGAPTKKNLLDLVEARLPTEIEATALAARHATPDDVRHIEALLDRAANHLADDDLLNTTNMSFHTAIARASRNGVMHQLLDALATLYQREQRAIMDIFGSRTRDHAEHVAILEAIRAHDEGLASERMRAHLVGVREVLLRWDGQAPPVPS
jgi:GntR family transcriptional repressor for pyruvate dehydrogenase complex